MEDAVSRAESPDYLIVGGGMTADAAVRGIRSEDPKGTILLLSAESHPPYDRPPLSKGLWTGDDEERIWRGTEDVGARVRTGCRAVSLDRERRRVATGDGDALKYRRLLLATGARPRLLEGSAADQVIHYRTLDDFRALRTRLRAGGRLALVGGGFIGCELAGTLAQASHSDDADLEIHLTYPESLPLERSLPAPFGELLARHLRDAGVRLHPGRLVTEVTGEPDNLSLQWERAGGTAQSRPSAGNDETASSPAGVDGNFRTVVAGLGVEPRVELAGEAGLEVADGIVVDRTLRTIDPRIFAAGDVASFPISFVGGRHRVEHEEHANASGMTAGRAMAGAEVDYDPLPYVYSGIGPLTLELLGLPSPDHQVEVTAPDAPEGRGLAVFRHQGRTTGALVWNRPGRAHRIRKRLRTDTEPPTLDELLAILD